MTNLTEEEIVAAVKKIAELDAARTPDEWIEGLYTNNVAVASPADAPILKEWVEKYRAGAAHLPNIRDIRYRRLVSVGGDYGSTFSPEPYAGEGMTKADQAFIAAAPLMAAIIKQLYDERQQRDVVGEDAGFVLLDQELLDKFYHDAISNRPSQNVHLAGLILAYEHFSAIVGTPRERRIDTTADRIRAAKHNTEPSQPPAQQHHQDVVGEDVVQLLEHGILWVREMREGVNKWCDPFEQCGVHARLENLESWSRKARAALAALPASLPRVSVEEVAGVIRGEFMGRDWMSTPMGVMVHDIASAIRNNFPLLFKE